jgi:hypothetical protein
MNCSSVRKIGDKAGIVQQRDLDAVAGDRRQVLEREVMRAPLGAEPDFVDIGLLELGAGPQMHDARRSVDDDVVAVLGD